ncbi:hypothetical protein CKM354_000266400 [Cercospora kikuchii]|uniref:Uncharacterized protein n=1 Tax=Cercospora kikuchii TaxID=84275 RepID=A0A9P3CF59_9PEZI|nr:uncharacterized protein CKM354_000266400 [Cercospora kikuchii]GIZ39275.1 hypothetical protein CKM354_000266400 [Cercospora kikuchii]
MQLAAALQHRHPPPGFANHTPREWEITAVCPAQSLPYSDDMFGLGPGIGRTVGGAGPPYTEASTMGQAPSSAPATNAKSDHLRKASSSAILREDSIQQTFEDSQCPSPATDYTPALSRSDSWSIHYDCTTQAPYSSACPGGGPSTVGSMNTQTSLTRLPKDNPSHDLAYFLKNTAPPLAHRKPRRVLSGRTALRLLRNGNGSQRKPRSSLIQSAHDRLNGVLRDEGGLLPGSVPRNCEQKISSTGKRYLALVPEQPELDESGDTSMEFDEPSILSPDILESRVSVCFHDDVTSATDDILDNWLSSYADSLTKQQTHSISDQHTIISDRSSKPPSSFQDVASRLSRQHHYSDTPIRPAASVPPSPIPESAISMADSYHSSVFDRPPPRLSFDTTRALTSHPTSGKEAALSRSSNVALPHEAFPVKHPSPGKEVQIRHPVPRRLGSHPVLLQRASSIASMMYQRSQSEHRSSCDSPGPPPPRSPLRLRRDPRTIEGIISNHENSRGSTARLAPSIKSASEFNFDLEPIRATVTTECSGPIKRPRSRGKKERGKLPGAPYPSPRREREERVRARKLRDKPTTSGTIDAVVNEPEQSTKQRLKKMRPRIQIPTLIPHRATSTASDASSSASYKKVTQSTASPVSPVPSLASEISEEDNMGCTPISPTASAEVQNMQAGLQMSPMMFVAEQVPVPKTTKTPSSPKLIMRETKSSSKTPYKPRPRSASLPRNALRHRNRQSVSNRSSPRSSSPVLRASFDIVSSVDLPSPPPTRAPPPTPPQSVIEKPAVSNTGAKRSVQGKELPTVPSYEVSPISTSSAKKFPHIVATQRKPHTERNNKPEPSTSTTNRAASRIDARLEALEKQNALLSAALMAVLKTNGQLNGPLAELGIQQQQVEPAKPMAWETRVARRSEATMASTNTNTTTGSSSGNDSALEMYMSTRQGRRRQERGME